MKLFRRKKPRRITEVDEAEAIYRNHSNECCASTCPCGRPVEVIVSYHRNPFKVAEFWTCREHQGAKGWERAKSHSSRPLHARPNPCIGCGVERICHGHLLYVSGSEEWICEIPPARQAA